VAEGLAEVAAGEHDLRVERRIGTGAIVEVGQQHDVAVSGDPIAHAVEHGTDPEPVHVEDHGRPGPGAIRPEHTGRAVAVLGSDGDSFAAHAPAEVGEALLELLRSGPTVARGVTRATALDVDRTLVSVWRHVDAPSLWSRDRSHRGLAPARRARSLA